MEEILTSGQAYKLDLLNSWKEIWTCRVIFRNDFLKEEANPQILNNYVALLTSLYVELDAILEGRADLEALRIEMKQYYEYCRNPQRLKLRENYLVLFNLEELERRVLEKLGITRFEEVIK